MDERIIYSPRKNTHNLPVVGQIIGYNDITNHEHFTGEVVEITWDAEKDAYCIKLKRR